MAPASMLSDPAGLVDMGGGNPSASVAEKIELLAFLPPRTAESSQDIFCCMHGARTPADLGTRALPIRKLKLTQTPRQSLYLENRLAGMNLREPARAESMFRVFRPSCLDVKGRLVRVPDPGLGHPPMAFPTRDTGTMLSPVRLDVV